MKIKKHIKSRKKTSTFKGGAFTKENRPIPDVINEEYQTEQGGFKPGNPGRPKGSKNARTVFIEAMLECFGPSEQRTFKQFLKRPNRQYLQGLDRIISVANIGSNKSGSGGGAEDMPTYSVIIEGQDGNSVASQEKPR